MFPMPFESYFSLRILSFRLIPSIFKILHKTFYIFKILNFYTIQVCQICSEICYTQKEISEIL